MAAGWKCLILIAAVAITYANGQKCNSDAPPETAPAGWVLSKIGAAFLQIYRDVKIPCSGFVTSWRFKSNSADKSMKPFLSVWEAVGTDSTIKFTLVGSNIITGPLKSLGNDWYEYDVPSSEQFYVDSSRNLYRGIFYTSLTESEYLSVYYLDKVRQNGADFSKASDSTIVAYMGLEEIIATTMANNQTLLFDTEKMYFDMRQPYLQLYIDSAGTGEAVPSNLPSQKQFENPSAVEGEKDYNVEENDCEDGDAECQVAPVAPVVAPTTAPPTTVRPTTAAAAATTAAGATTRGRMTTRRRPTTVKMTTSAFGSVCIVPPMLNHAYFEDEPKGFVGENVTFKCEFGYRMIKDPVYTCTPEGVWVGEGYCGASSAACYVPSSGAAGDCGVITRKWSFDRRTRRCTWFYWGGCGGTSNTFDSEEQCMEICGFLAYMSPLQLFYKLFQNLN